MFFPFVKNDVVLIKLNVLGGLEICSPRKIFNGSTSETVSEHLDGESLSVMPPPPMKPCASMCTVLIDPV